MGGLSIRSVTGWLNAVLSEAIAALVWKHVAKAIPLEGLSVLDVGLDEDVISLKHLQLFGACVTVMDRRPEVKAIAERLEVPFVVEDCTAMPFGNQTFDVVVLSFVIYRVRTSLAIKALREAIRVGKKCLLVNPSLGGKTSLHWANILRRAKVQVLSEEIVKLQDHEIASIWIAQGSTL